MQGRRQLLVKFLLMIFCFVVSPYCFSAENNKTLKIETDGFKGVKWGTDLSKLKDMELIDKTPGGRYTVYIKRNEELNLAGVNLDKVQYISCEGKICDYKYFNGISIDITGYDNYQKLLKILSSQFGQGRLIKNDKTQVNIWKSENTETNLWFSKDKDHCALTIRKK